MLIAALVALPTIALTAGTVIVASTVPTTDETLAYTLGRTEAMLRVISPPDPTLRQSPTRGQSYLRDVDDDYVPTGYARDDVPVAPSTVLPAGTRVLSTTESSVTVRTSAGIDALPVIEGDAGDPALEGRFHLAEGRVPHGDGEIALTASALPRLGVELGGTLRITDPRAVTASVVGVIEDRSRDRSEAVMFVSDGALTGSRADENPMEATYYLPDTALDWDAVQELNRDGIVVDSRYLVRNPPAASEYPAGISPSNDTSLSSGYVQLVVLIGGFLLFEVCLLAGAAFIVGMRADQRALATVASVGGEPRLIARIVSRGGLVLGGVGGLVGVGLGVLAAWGYYVWTDDGNAITLPGFHPWWWALGGVFLVAVASGWIAALTAARGARRIDVVAALRGSRRPRPVRRRRAVAGVVVVISGIAVLAIGGVLAVLSGWPRTDPTLVPVAMGAIVVGSVVLMLGLVMATPALLALASRILSRTSEAARLAGRDASRNHARSAPAVAAVMTTVFVASFLMTVLASFDENTAANWQYNAPVGTVTTSLASWDETGSAHFPSSDTIDEVAALVTSVLAPTELGVLDAVPGPIPWGPDKPDAVWTLPRVHGDPPCTTDAYGNVVGSCSGLPAPFQPTNSPRIYVGDVDDLAVLIGGTPSDEAARMLRDGGAIAFWPQYVDDGRLTLDTWSDAQVRNRPFPEADATPLGSTTVPALVLDPGFQLRLDLMISASTADALGLEHGPSLLLAHREAAPTPQQYQALRAGLPQIVGSELSVSYEAGPPQTTAVGWAALGVTALISFAAASVAIGLARADGRRDEEVLDAIGAPPRLRRGVAFWQAIVIAGIGTVLGAAVGLLPVLALHLATVLGPADAVANGPMPDFAPPWLQLGLTVVGVPLAIALGSWATATRRRTAVRRIP